MVVFLLQISQSNPEAHHEEERPPARYIFSWRALMTRALLNPQAAVSFPRQRTSLDTWLNLEPMYC